MMDSHETVALVVAGVAAFALQLISAPYICIGPAMPNFIVVFVFLCVVTRAQIFGCVAPFVLGLVYDFLSGNPVGAMAFSLTLFSFIGARVYSAMENDTLFMPLAVMGAGILLTETAYGLFLLATGYNAGFFEAFALRALPCAVYDCVVAFLLYPLAVRLFAPSGPTSPIVASQLR